MINKENIFSVEKNYNVYGDFVSYKTTFNTDKICFVPLDEANSDYQAIQEWIAAGGIVIDNAPSGTEADGGTVIDNGGGE